MLTAHLPSGYILGKRFSKNGRKGALVSAAMLGAVTPDFDMFYFHFVDFGHTHHHMFVSHWPLAWLALGVPVVALAHMGRRVELRNTALAFFAAVMLHLGLDSIAAPIFWLAPFAQGRVELVLVPANYSHWIISYLLHWTFAFEVMIWLTALFLFWRSAKLSSTGAGR